MPRSGHVAAVRQALRGQRERLSGLRDVLWRQKLIVLACVGLVLGMTAAYVSTLARTYGASALVAPGDRPAQQVGQDAPVEGDSLEEQLRRIESRAMAERLVDRLDLHFLPEFRPDAAAHGFRLGDLLPKAILDRLPTAWADALATRPPDPTMTDEQRAAEVWDEAIAATMARIRAEAISSSTIALEFTSGDAQLAAAGANALAELYLEGRGPPPQTSSGHGRSHLAQEIDRLRASIRETEQAIAAARPAGAQTRETGEQSRLDLTGELAFWRRERAELEARLQQTQAALASGADLDRMALGLNSERLHQLQASTTELQQALAELAQQYGEEDPSIVELRAQLATLEQERRAEIEHLVQGMQEELAIIRSREGALETKIAGLQEQAAEGREGDDIAVLEDRLQAERAALRGYLEQATAELGSQPSASVADARVIAPAVVPEGPTHPRLALIWSVATAGALLLGIALGFAREALQRGRE